MGKNKILSFLLLLLFMLSACAVVKRPVSSSSQSSVSDVGSTLESATTTASTATTAAAVTTQVCETSSTQISTEPSVASTAAPTAAPRTAKPTSKSTQAVAQEKPMPSVTAKMPEASGRSVFSEQGATIDYSNTSQGYIMVNYNGSKKIKVLVYFNGGSSYYQYNITGNDGYTTLPLQSGSGSYRIRFMENVSGSSYAELCSTEISASVGDFGCNEYPNQYVNYSRNSAAVAKARSLCANCANNAEKVAAVYQYITSNIKYDYAKANSVQSGYLPNVDSTLSTQKGICFDYSVLMATMCRSQGIPTKLVIGTASVGYHAWNEVYLNGWKRYDSTFGAVGQSVSSYTAEKYY